MPVTDSMTQSSRFATAVHILTLLANEADDALTSEYIAGSVNTNPVIIRRLVGALAKYGLVTSSPGSAGGTRLSRDPRKITLLDVYQAVDPGKLFGTHAQQPNPKCPVGHNIVDILGRHIEAAEGAATSSLRRTTIADLVSEVKKRA